MKIGAQMYTLKAFGQNERDLGRALEKVARIGYRSVQLSALGPIDPKKIRALCDDNGLEIVLTHNPESDFLYHTEELIEKHRIYGCRYIGLGYLPDRYHQPDFLPYFGEDYAEPARKIREAGMKMMYHNHAFEFARMPDGRSMMDHLLDMLPADLMGVTADTYWLQYGGMDVCDWLEKHADRLSCVHFKDMSIRGFDIRMAAVGKGNLNFPAILEVLKKNGTTEHVLVEQDDCYGESPFDCLKQSFDYLKSIS